MSRWIGVTSDLQDVAPEGQIWLSSQNRNFRNRMGKGSFGNLSSAACVAASSFDMVITDPRPFLALIDQGRLRELLDLKPLPDNVAVVEPIPSTLDSCDIPASGAAATDLGIPISGPLTGELPQQMSGRIQRFGESVDTVCSKCGV